MSDASTLAELPFAAGENTDPLPVPQRTTTPDAPTNPIHEALIRRTFYRVEENDFSHPDEPASELNDSDQENIPPPVPEVPRRRPQVHTRSEEPKQLSPSPTMPPPTKPSLPLLPEYVTQSIVMTSTSAKSKRSFASLAPFDTEERPAKMTKLRHSSRNCTRFDDWNLDLSRLPLRHMHPLTSPFRHLPFRETRKSW